MTGPDLFDVLKEIEHPQQYAGVRQADQGTDEWWRSCADRGIATLAATGREFTADDLRALGVPPPDHSNRWGPRFTAARRAGLIELVGAQPSTTGSRRGGLVRVWRGRRAAA